MKTNIEIEKKEGFLTFYVTGEYDKIEIMNYIQLVKDKCAEEDMDKVLVDFQNMKGSITKEMDRFYIGEALSKILGSKIKIAAVWDKKNINKFAETVAVNRGAKLKVFSDPDDAKKWLLS